MSRFGDVLRDARDAKGVTLREAERATRISLMYLAALEAEDFAKLPPAAYARGIVRNYAQYLGLDPGSVLAQYESASGTRVVPVEVVPATRPLDAPSHWAPNFAIIAFMVVMSAIVFAWMYSAYFRESTTLATSTVGIPTVTPVSASILSTPLAAATSTTVSGLSESPAPSPSPTSTPTPSLATPTPIPAPPTEQPAAPATVAAVEEAVPDVTTEVDETAVEEVAAEDPLETDSADDEETAGAHSFGIWAVEDVWVQVLVDGELVLEETVPAGTDYIFEGDSVQISSGNSASLRIYVDGEEYVAGEEWDSSFVYP